MPYELDGGARGTVKKLRIKVHPGSIKLCLPVQFAGADRPLVEVDAAPSAGDEDDPAARAVAPR